MEPNVISSYNNNGYGIYSEDELVVNLPTEQIDLSTQQSHHASLLRQQLNNPSYPEYVDNVSLQTVSLSPPSVNQYRMNSNTPQINPERHSRFVDQPPSYSVSEKIASEAETRRALENAAKIPEIPKRGEIPNHSKLVILTIICFPFVILHIVFLIRYLHQLKHCLAYGDLILAQSLSERIRKICIYTVLIGIMAYLAAIGILLPTILSTSA